MAEEIRARLTLLEGRAAALEQNVGISDRAQTLGATGFGSTCSACGMGGYSTTTASGGACGMVCQMCQMVCQMCGMVCQMCGMVCQMCGMVCQMCGMVCQMCSGMSCTTGGSCGCCGCCGCCSSCGTCGSCGQESSNEGAASSAPDLVAHDQAGGARDPSGPVESAMIVEAKTLTEDTASARRKPRRKK